jgi:anthranilate phosphoribosyltransferase
MDTVRCDDNHSVMIQPHEVLKQLVTGSPMTEPQAEEVFAAILSGQMDEAQIGCLLGLISARGPTVDELVGGARVMRRCVTRVEPPETGATLIDTCGTGGAPKLFNISTAGAIIAAAAAPGRVMVAKHGSLSRTGRGSAEVLGALGVNTAAPADVQTRCLREVGVCFCFAVHHHPAMKHAAGVRRSLGFPTIFNLLGPLTNPAGARRQLVGAYSQDLALKIAHTLARLGVDSAMVVSSHDGLDELTTTNTNLVHTVEHGEVRTRVLDAAAAPINLPRASIESLRVHSLEAAAAAVRDCVRGVAGPTLDVALLNAGAALVVAGAAPSIADGIVAARECVASGAAARTLDALVRLTNQSPTT